MEAHDQQSEDLPVYTHTQTGTSMIFSLGFALFGITLGLFVMGHEPGCLVHELSVDGVLHFLLHCDHNGFLHVIAYHNSDALASCASCRFHIHFIAFRTALDLAPSLVPLLLCPAEPLFVKP